MQIIVKRDNFIKQFPVLRLPVLQMEEDFLLINGEILQKDSPLILENPKLFKIFTNAELAILKELYGHKIPVRSEVFSHIFHAQDSKTMYSNSYNKHGCLNVHIKNMRKKIIIHKLPFKIETRRGWGYQLIEL